MSKEGSQREESEIQSQVQLCPAILGSQEQLCGHVMPERDEAGTPQRASSASHFALDQRAVWSEALGGRPEHCMEKSSVKQLESSPQRLFCYTQGYNPWWESWQRSRGLKAEDTKLVTSVYWSNNKSNMFAYCKFLTIQLWKADSSM